MTTEPEKQKAKKGTVMMRVTVEVRDMVAKLAMNDETADAVLRRVLGMPEAIDETGLVRSLGEWPFKKLELHQGVVIPWPKNPNTQLTDEKKLDRIRRAVYRHQKSSTNLYHMQGEPTGLRVTRIR